LLHMFSICMVLRTCSSGLGRLGHQHKCTSFLVVLLEYQSVISRMKSPRSGLHGLYLAMALLNTLFWEFGLIPGL
jgi:hypothetical protein